MRKPRSSDIAPFSDESSRVVLDGNQRVYLLSQLLEALVGGDHPPLTLEGERTSDDANRESAIPPGYFGDDGSRAGTRAASHPGRDEHHVRTLQQFSDVFLVLADGLASQVRIPARSHSTRRHGTYRIGGHALDAP